MGYDYIINRGDSNFHISAVAGKAAKAARVLEEWRVKRNVSPGFWPWEPVLSETNCIIGFKHGGDKGYYYESMLQDLAPLVTPGSVLAFVGEDDNCWEFTFDGRGFEEGQNHPGIAEDAFADQLVAEGADETEDAWAEFDNFDYYSGDWRTTLCGSDRDELGWEDQQLSYQEHRVL